MHRHVVWLFALLSLTGCQKAGHEAGCAPMPSAEGLSKASSDNLWTLVDNYRLCRGDNNFPKEEAMLRALIRRQDARATFELGSELMTGAKDRRAEGADLERASANLGYGPAQEEIKASNH